MDSVAWDYDGQQQREMKTLERIKKSSQKVEKRPG